MVIRRGFTNRERMKRSKKQGRQEKVTFNKTEFQKIARRDKKAFFNEQCLTRQKQQK